MSFVRAAKADEIAPGTIRDVEVSGKTIAVANVEGTYYAIDSVCVHQGGPLGEGPVEGCTVICPWHAWEYDLKTGKLVGNPDIGVASYPVEVRGDEIFVDVS